jgi:HlyD family secretion protein
VRWSRVIGLLVVAGIGSGAAYWAYREEPLQPIEVVVAEARKTTVVQKVRGVGHVEPVTQVKISSNVTGDLLSLHVKEGEQVKRGALLAQIDRERLMAVVRQNQANARSVAATVQLESAQLQQAELEAKRTDELHKRGLATDAERERSHAEASVVRARLESAKQRVEQAQAALDEANEHLKKSTLYAPIDGTVIDLNKKVGERIRGSDLGEDVLLVIAPLHAMQVEVEISEQDVVNVAPGQKAEIEIDALGESIVPGRVVEIANSAVVKNRGTEMETTSFLVKVALEDIPPRLRSGMSASVAIVAQSHPDVIAAPIEAVTARRASQLEIRAEKARKREDRLVLGDTVEAETGLERREKPVDVVFVVEGDHVEARRVRTGISSDTEVEVIEGLTGKEEIVVAPYKALAKDLLPGSPIRISRRQQPPKPEGAPAEARR